MNLEDLTGAKTEP